MRSSFFFLLSIVLPVCTVALCNGQQGTIKRVEEVRDIFYCNEMGELQRSRVSLMRLDDGSDMIELLRDPDVQRDVGIVAAQVSELDNLRKEFESLELYVRKDASSQEEFEIRVRSFRDKVSELFTEEQLRRLKQVQIWKQINKSTLVMQLISGEVGRQLGLSNRHRSQLADLQLEEAKRLKEECKRFREEAIARLTDVLSVKQRNQLAEFFSEFDSLPVFAPLDILVFQCEELDKIEDSNALPVDLAKYEYLIIRSMYEVSDSAQLRSFTQKIPPKRHQLLTSIFLNLVAEIRNNAMESENNILEYQREACQKLSDEFRSISNRLVRERTEISEGRTWTDADQDRYNKELESFLSGAIDEIDELLLPIQHEYFLERAKRAKVLHNGIPYVLLHDLLVGDVRISDEQKEELKDVCGKIVAEYKDFSLAAEKDHIRRVLEVLPVSIDKKLDELIGEPIGKASFAIEVLSFKLAGA